jgi:hypothetical protein
MLLGPSTNCQAMITVQQIGEETAVRLVPIMKDDSKGLYF